MPSVAHSELSSPAVFNVRGYVQDYLEVLRQLDVTMVEKMARIILEAWRANRTVFCCGNGGSASSSSHFIMDLTKLTAPTRGHRLRAMALNENCAAISAISNDIAYEEIFVEQLRPFLSPGDVLIGFSTSGSSPNVIRAMQYGNAAGAVTIGITGSRGLKLKTLAQHTLMVQSTSVQQVEDATMVVGHLLCLRVKELIEQDTLRPAMPFSTAQPTMISAPLHAVDNAGV
jgi:D-sedoheptulose 7-phosphate isomerase